jgi:hypothetical protein
LIGHSVTHLHSRVTNYYKSGMGSGVLKAQDIYWVSILLGMAFITGEPGLTIPYQYPPPPATADAGWQETSFISFTFLKTARDDGGGCGMTE